MRRMAILRMFVAAVGLAGAAAAHEGHSHGAQKTMGTAKAVHADMNHVEITVKGGKVEGFYVNADTKYLKGSKEVSLTDLMPGTRVIVDTRMDGQKMVATVVRVGRR